ncbi:MAG: methyltransferase domain-containing protein [Bacteroidetes bacterium]|nr:methyltransferase domain-containing protein [Bacteroidota bacterium]
MEEDSFYSHIEPSESDRILHGYGCDLVREYFSVARHVPVTHQPIVELATGTGRMIAVLSTFAPSILTGDITLHDLPRAHKRVPLQFRDRVSYLQLTMEHLPFCTDFIRSMICMNTMHETEHPELCLMEMIRTIHPEGTLIVGDFNRKGFDVMQKVQQQVYHTDHHEGCITTEQIRAILNDSFNTVTAFETELNLSYIASDKRSHQN